MPLFFPGMGVELSRIVVKRAFVAALAVAALACRGEAPPRDYQNAPPAMTHPAKSAKQTPSANGMPAAAPEPSKGAEGMTTKPVDPVPAPPAKLKDQAPATQTQT